jgi:dCTP diphosphatase
VQSTSDMGDLQQELREFAAEREWERFHSPKNLAMALACEAGEVLEHFQWLSEVESETLSEQVKEAVSEELADVYLYLIRLADRLSINLTSAAHKKIAVNAKKYPIEQAKGNANKYTTFRTDGTK